MKDKAYKTDVNPKYSEYKKGLATMVYKLFWQKTGSRANAN